MIFFLLFAVPLLLALTAEYAVCRFLKHRIWRWVLPEMAALVTVEVALYRYHGWSTVVEKAPWETLVFIPGLPALGAFLGLWLGWKLWKRLWLPRVVDERK